jgi:hypothetical protein
MSEELILFLATHSDFTAATVSLFSIVAPEGTNFPLPHTASMSKALFMMVLLGSVQLYFGLDQRIKKSG